MSPAEQSARARIVARERIRRVESTVVPPLPQAAGQEWLALVDALRPRLT